MTLLEDSNTIRTDLFHVATPTRAYYYPSRQQELTDEERQMYLSPSKKDGVVVHAENEWVDNKTLSSSAFEESWPSTTDKTISVDNNGGRSCGGNGSSRSHQQSTRDHTEEKSTLARFVDRFRHAPPSSRSARQSQVDYGSDFWWLRASSPVTSSPERDRETTKLQFGKGQKTRTQQNRDTKEDRLGERAKKLLKMSEHVFGSSSSSFDVTQVSSDGILSGTSSSSLPAQRYPPASQIGQQLSSAFRQPQAIRGVRAGTTEDDILHRWRVQHRMERARASVVQGREDPHFGLGPCRPPVDRIEAIPYKRTVPTRSRFGFVESAFGSADIRNASRQVGDQTTNLFVSEQLEQQEFSQAAHQSSNITDPHIQSAPASTLEERLNSYPTLLPPCTVENAAVAPHTHLLCDIVTCNHLSAAVRSAALSRPNCHLASPRTNQKQQLQGNKQQPASQSTYAFQPGHHQITDVRVDPNHVRSRTNDKQSTVTRQTVGADLASVFAQDQVLQSLLIQEQRCQDRLRSLAQLLDQEGK